MSSQMHTYIHTYMYTGTPHRVANYKILTMDHGLDHKISILNSVGLIMDSVTDVIHIHIPSTYTHNYLCQFHHPCKESLKTPHEE